MNTLLLWLLLAGLLALTLAAGGLVVAWAFSVFGASKVQGPKSYER